jgi:hypothetical protein
MTAAEHRHFQKRLSLLETENEALRQAHDAMHVAYRTRCQRHEIEAKLIADGDGQVIKLLEEIARLKTDIDRLHDERLALVAPPGTPPESP